MARCGVPGIDLPVERVERFECGCHKRWGRQGWRRYWVSECTVEEHKPERLRAS